MTMGYLATAFPPLRRIRALPLSRDQIMLLMAATNEIFLAVDIYLAHSISGTIRPNEWIPIIFGPIAGGLLLLAGLIALRRRPLATVLATVVLLSSIAVGLLGAYFHIVRAILPSGPPGERVTVDLLVWAPPVLGPLTFALVGILGISAAWVEDPPDSGVLVLLGRRRLRLPYSKTRAYLFMVGLGTLATVISSVLDHARTGFENPWLWVPTVAGIFGTVVAVTLGSIDRPTRADLAIYTFTMLLLIAVGVVGAVLHIGDNLTSQGDVVVERFIRGAPFMAPLLFSNMGTLGLIALLDPEERR
jgi:nitrate reductase NapE component